MAWRISTCSLLWQFPFPPSRNGYQTALLAASKADLNPFADGFREFGISNRRSILRRYLTVVSDPINCFSFSVFAQYLRVSAALELNFVLQD